MSLRKQSSGILKTNRHHHPNLHQNVHLIHRFPQSANPLPSGRPRKVKFCQSSSVLGSPPRLRQQPLIQQLRPLSSDQRLPADKRPATSQTAPAESDGGEKPTATSGHADSTTRFTATSPRQRMAELRVAPGVTNVLIGDSVARPIKPDLVFPGGQSQNLSVSGLAIDDVNHWLANISRNREVKRVVIHIGVNTCKFAVITESIWRQLIRKLKPVFPGSCRAGVFHRSSHGAIEKDCPSLQRSAPGSLQQREGVSCRPHLRLHCPERCAAEGPVQGPGTSQ